MNKAIDFILGLLIWACLLVLASEKTPGATYSAFWTYKGIALVVGAVCSICLTKRINKNGKLD